MIKISYMFNFISPWVDLAARHLIGKTYCGRAVGAMVVLLGINKEEILRRNGNRGSRYVLIIIAVCTKTRYRFTFQAFANQNQFTMFQTMKRMQ